MELPEEKVFVILFIGFLKQGRKKLTAGRRIELKAAVLNGATVECGRIQVLSLWEPSRDYKAHWLGSGQGTMARAH